MESEESKEAVCVNENRKSTLLMPRFLSRLAQLPIVKSACEQMSDMYERTKEKNLVSMVGFSAAEVSMNAVVVAAKITYTALPSSGVLGKMKEGLEEKVSQADSMACDGLEFLENKWPVIKDNTEKVMEVGAQKLEQSDLAEVLLTVTEAAVDYFNSPQEKPKEEGTADPPVAQSKVDRIRGISNIIMGRGEKVISLAASVPGRVTMAGIDGAKTVVTWSWDVSQSLLYKFPVMEEMLAAFWDSTNQGNFSFLPAVLGDREEKELVGRQKPRRSSRYKAKPEYSRMIDASEPFTVSPERKRRYDREDEEEDVLIVELVNVSEDYVSDEDPDYVPDKDELEKSESSEDEDDDEDEDNENEEQGDNKELETVEETTGSKEISPHTATQPKESGEEMNKGQNCEAKNPSKQYISDKEKTVAKKKETATKGGEPNHCEKNGGKEIEAKNLDSQKKEKDILKMAAKNAQKNGTPGNKVEGRIVV